MSRLLRDGEYVIFHNNIFYPSGKKSPTEGMIYIISENRYDLRNGFMPINVEYKDTRKIQGRFGVHNGIT